MKKIYNKIYGDGIKYREKSLKKDMFLINSVQEI